MVDPDQDPARIDITRPLEKDSPAALGIYKVDGDTLTPCVADDRGADRPTRFEAPDGARVLLMTFKRAKKD